MKTNNISNRLYKIKIKNIDSSSSRTTVGSNIKPKIINLNGVDIDNKNIEIISYNNKKEIKDDINTTKLKKGKSQINILEKKNLLFKNIFKKRLNSISKEYYNGMELNRAPSIYNNKKSISQVINRNNIEKNDKFKNFYNHFKVNSSKISRNNIYFDDNCSNMAKIRNIKKLFIQKKSLDNSFLNKFNNGTNLSINNNPINSSINIYTSKTDNNKEESQEHIFPTILNNNNNNKRIMSYKTIFKDNNNSSSRMSMKDENKNSVIEESKSKMNNTVLMTLLPIIPFSKRYKLFNSISTIKEKNKDIDYSNFDTNKINEYIYTAFKNKYNKPSELTSLEEHIIKIKYLIHIQSKTLNILLENDKYNIEKKNYYLKELTNIYNNIWDNYIKEMNNYLNFLSEEKKKIRIELEIKIRDKIELKKIIESLLIKTVKKQKQLEHLVDIRNFLLQVKLKLVKQPAYFKTLLYRDSKKIELGNCILNSNVGTKNTDVIMFLDSFSFLNLVELYEVNSSKKTKELIKKKMNKKNVKNMIGYYSLPKEFKKKFVLNNLQLNNKNDYIPKKGEIIFNSIEQFHDKFQNFEQRNLLLLNKNNEMKISNEIYRQEYEKICTESDNQIFLDIKNKINILKEIKEKHKLLKKNYNYLKNLDFVIINKDTKKLIQNKENSAFIDINDYKMIKYLKLLNKYKYKGMLLLEILINYIKSFISCKYDNYDINRCYRIIGELKLNNIFDMAKNSFSGINKLIINDSILILLKIYEDICLYVNNKHILYELNENNKIIMKNKFEELKSQRKLEYSRIIKLLIEEKRHNNIKKIIDKWNTPLKRVRNNICTIYNLKTIKKEKNKSIGKIESQKRIFNQKEFNDFTFYN